MNGFLALDIKERLLPMKKIIALGMMTVLAFGIGNCPCCGVKVAQNPGRKAKRFCSDKCRNKWWNSRLDQVERKAHYEFVCAYCKKPFTAYGNAGRKYCSHECYIKDRFGGGQDAKE